MDVPEQLLEEDREDQSKGKFVLQLHDGRVQNGGEEQRQQPEECTEEKGGCDT